MIEVAALLSLVIHHMVDFWIILILLFSNAVAGFIEEHSAENVIEILKRKMALVAELPEKDMIEDILHMGLCPVLDDGQRHSKDDNNEICEDRK